MYEAIEEYKLLLSQPDEKIDVLLGSALIAQHKYPLLVSTCVCTGLETVMLACCSLGQLCVARNPAAKTVMPSCLAKLLLRLLSRHNLSVCVQDYDLIEDQLDDLAVQVEAVLPPSESRYPLRVVQAISAHLYDNRGFRGNTEVSAGGFQCWIKILSKTRRCPRPGSMLGYRDA